MSRPSSYWSVQEARIFPTYLDRYGSDWNGIAMTIGTKSAAMVKNYYFRLLDKSDEAERTYLTGIVQDANERLSRDLDTSDREISPSQHRNEQEEGSFTHGPNAETRNQTNPQVRNSAHVNLDTARIGLLDNRAAAFDTSGAVAEYHMQLLLLEQENKRRFFARRLRNQREHQQ